MRIVICDDDAEFANELRALAEKGLAALDIHPEFFGIQLRRVRYLGYPATDQFKINNIFKNVFDVG